MNHVCSQRAVGRRRQICTQIQCESILFSQSIKYYRNFYEVTIYSIVGDLLIQQVFTENLLYHTHSFHLSTVARQNLGNTEVTRQARYLYLQSFYFTHDKRTKVLPLQGFSACCFFCSEDFNCCMTGFSSSEVSALMSPHQETPFLTTLSRRGSPPTSVSLYFITPSLYLFQSSYFHQKVIRARTR